MKNSTLNVRKSEILFLYESTYSMPNGDPFTGEQRFDEETKKILVSDVRIKRFMVTFMIPRVIWQDKPVVSDPRKYADLYFNYSENSFTITPMGDLLRNFGPIGVPLGMIILGFIIRIIYSALVEEQEFSFWRVTLFYMLLTSISYEGFYGTIIPYMFKVLIVSMIGIFIVRFFIKEKQKV